MMMTLCIVAYTTGTNYLHLIKYFEENESIHYCNTRQKHDFHSFTVNSEVEKIDRT